MKILVTGGGGFLGKRIVELLLEREHEVLSLARGAYPEVEALGATCVQADLRDADAVLKAVEGVDAVFHVAAKAGAWGPREQYWGINVEGTRNLLDACEKAGVGKLVYTSTPSVVSYEHDIVNGAQDLPYATSYKTFYPESKAEAERMVLRANSRHIATVSLRPHLIFGPGDNNLLPRFLLGHLKGRLRILGDGTNVVDATFVDNAAWAHLDAAAALSGPDAPCAGKAYFISNDEPVKLWEWVNDFLPRVEAPPVNKKISLGVASTVGGLMEGTWRLFNLSGEPRMTKFLAAALARSHWYDMTPAKEDFGYRIRVPLAEGTDRTVAWFKEAD